MESYPIYDPPCFFLFSSLTKSAISLGIPGAVGVVMSKCEVQVLWGFQKRFITAGPRY